MESISVLFVLSGLSNFLRTVPDWYFFCPKNGSRSAPFVQLHVSPLAYFSSPQECKWMWACPLVVHPPQGSVCYVFWDAFLFTTVVKSSLSGHSPLSSLINMVFLTWCINCVWGHWENSCFWSTQTLATSTMPLSKSLGSNFLFDVNVNWSSWRASAWFDLFHCCSIMPD